MPSHFYWTLLGLLSPNVGTLTVALKACPMLDGMRKAKLGKRSNWAVSLRTQRQLLYRLLVTYDRTSTRNVGHLFSPTISEHLGLDSHPSATTDAPVLRSLKADSHTACRAHAVPLPRRAAKGLECVFPI